MTRPQALVASIALLSLVVVLAGCNTKSMANERKCKSLSGDACRADSTCIAIGKSGALETNPLALAEGKRCDPACFAGGLPIECRWSTSTTTTDPKRIARDGRVCDGPPRCRIEVYKSFEHCEDPDPPCAGCRQVFSHCQSVNLCSDVICL